MHFYTKKTHSLFVFAFAIICIACNPEEQKKPNLELKTSSEVLILPVDESTSNISDGLFYFAKENLLFSQNWKENSIQIYDIEKKKRVKNLKLERDGPNGVLDLMGIHVLSQDSIFLFNQIKSQITLIDTSGQIINSIQYKSPDRYSPAFVHNAYFQSPPLLHGKKLIVKTHYFGSIREMTQEILQTKELVYEIDLESGETRFLNLKFPKDFMPDGLKPFEASISHGADKLAFSLFGDHRLFYVSEYGDSLQSKNGKSAYLPERLPTVPKDADGLIFRKHSYYSPHYESLDFDPFRDVFIRFAFHEYEQDESVPVNDMRNHSGPFSIQVFDSDLNLISETAFEANQYHPFDYFITEKGIYLSTNHPLNPQNNEDQMSFVLLEYSEKEKP